MEWRIAEWQAGKLVVGDGERKGEGINGCIPNLRHGRRSPRGNTEGNRHFAHIRASAAQRAAGRAHEAAAIDFFRRGHSQRDGGPAASGHSLHA